MVVREEQAKVAEAKSSVSFITTTKHSFGPMAKMWSLFFGCRQRHREPYSFYVLLHEVLALRKMCSNCTAIYMTVWTKRRRWTARRLFPSMTSWPWRWKTLQCACTRAWLCYSSTSTSCACYGMMQPEINRCGRGRTNHAWKGPPERHFRTSFSVWNIHRRMWSSRPPASSPILLKRPACPWK